MEQHYVTIQGVADFFQVSVPTVRGWVKKGVIPPSSYLKISGTYRFRLDEVEMSLRGRSIPQDATPLEKEVAVAAVSDPRQLELNFNPDEDI